MAKIRAFRAWTSFSPSSVYYILEKLEKLGYLERKKVKREGAGAPRKVYFITESGMGALREEGLSYLSGKTGSKIDLDLGLVCAYVISPHEIVGALKENLRVIHMRLEEMDANIVAQGGLDSLPTPAWGVINNSRYMIDARIRLIEELIERYELETQ